MTVSLPQKVEPTPKRCQDILSMHEVSIKELAKLLATLSSTALAFPPAPLYKRYLQGQQIHNLCLERDYNSKLALEPFCKEELNWWIVNLSSDVIDFSPGITFKIARCIQDRLRGFLSEYINRRSIVSSRTSSTYKYTGKESSKIRDTFILQKQKGSSSPCTYGQSSSISLFGKNGRDKKRTHDSGDKWNMGILFSQSNYSYCRIPVGDFKN